jgi:hypothetical protein
VAWNSSDCATFRWAIETELISQHPTSNNNFCGLFLTTKVLLLVVVVGAVVVAAAAAAGYDLEEDIVVATDAAVEL